MESGKDSFYEDLFHRWKEEKSNRRLTTIPQDYYRRIERYIGELRVLLQELDEKSTKAVLLKKELEEVRRVAEELVEARRRKILGAVIQGKTPSAEEMTVEDEILCSSILSAVSSYNERMRIGFEEGASPREETEGQSTPKEILVRFLREIPAIVGSDMETYGPFKTEDVGTLPLENAMALIEQGVAVKVETSEDDSS